MAFCINCGKELVDGAKFCANCGTATDNTTVDSGSKRKTVYEGEIHKCPNCGEVLNSFVSNCPACGYELRGTKSSNSVHEFALKLERIEATREPVKAKSIIGKMYGSDGQLSKTDEQKIGLIRSFSIPNNKEDISEFMILAASNIDMKLYGLGNQGVLTASQRAVSDAWLAKFEQAYQKAKLSFGSTPDFVNINSVYEQKVKEIKRKKLEVPLLVVGILCLSFLPLILALALGAF